MEDQQKKSYLLDLLQELQEGQDNREWGGGRGGGQWVCCLFAYWGFRAQRLLWSLCADAVVLWYRLLFQADLVLIWSGCVGKLTCHRGSGHSGDDYRRYRLLCSVCIRFLNEAACAIVIP